MGVQETACAVPAKWLFHYWISSKDGKETAYGRITIPRKIFLSPTQDLIQLRSKQDSMILQQANTVWNLSLSRRSLRGIDLVLYLLGYYAMKRGRSLRPFQRNALHTSSGSQSKASKRQACRVPVSALFILRPWRWRQYTVPKGLQIFSTLHGTTSKMATAI
jgi:hypothetical protein